MSLVAAARAGAPGGAAVEVRMPLRQADAYPERLLERVASLAAVVAPVSVVVDARAVCLPSDKRGRRLVRLDGHSEGRILALTLPRCRWELLRKACAGCGVDPLALGARAVAGHGADEAVARDGGLPGGDAGPDDDVVVPEEASGEQALARAGLDKARAAALAAALRAGRRSKLVDGPAEHGADGSLWAEVAPAFSGMPAARASDEAAAARLDLAEAVAEDEDLGRASGFMVVRE